MGQKTIPNSLRLKNQRNWSSQEWIVEKQQYALLLWVDFEIKKYLKKVFLKKNIRLIDYKMKKISNDFLFYITIPPIKFFLRKKKNFFFKKKKKKNKYQKIKNKKLLCTSKKLYPKWMVLIKSNINNFIQRVLGKTFKVKIFFFSSRLVLFEKKIEMKYFLKCLKNQNKKNKKLKKLYQMFFYALYSQNINLLVNHLRKNLQKKKIQKKYIYFFIRIFSIFYKLYKPLLKGFKFQFKGRLNGRKRSQKLIFQEGSIPLNTISKNIKYSFYQFNTPAGLCSIKGWFHFAEEKKLYSNNQRCSFQKKQNTKKRLNKK